VDNFVTPHAKRVYPHAPIQYNLIPMHNPECRRWARACLHWRCSSTSYLLAGAFMGQVCSHTHTTRYIDGERRVETYRQTGRCTQYSHLHTCFVSRSHSDHIQTSIFQSQEHSQTHADTSPSLTNTHPLAPHPVAPPPRSHVPVASTPHTCCTYLSTQCTPYCKGGLRQCCCRKYGSGESFQKCGHECSTHVQVKGREPTFPRDVPQRAGHCG